jgi:hypothetical protein
VSGHLLFSRGAWQGIAALGELAAIREMGIVQPCPGLARGWIGFQLEAGLLIPVYDPAPDLPPAPLLVLAEIEGLRVAIAAEQIERVTDPPVEATALEALYASLSLM